MTRRLTTFRFTRWQKSIQRAEPSPLFAGLDDGFNGIIANILHGGQTKTDGLPNHAEVAVAIIDIGDRMLMAMSRDSLI